MADEKGQTQTLSLRINDVLRSRLETIRDLMSRHLGRSMTTSEVAKQLLETADGKRLEEISLYKAPTESMLAIQRKVSENLPLSRAEWTFLAQYVQYGMEGAGKNPISPESFIGVLEAFRALCPRRDTAFESNNYYLGNLSLPGYPSGLGPKTDAEVLEAVEATIQRVRKSARPFTPVFVARNLYVLLDQDKTRNVEALNEALLPYWPVLWRVAARGHYLYEKKPIRDAARPRELPGQSIFPSLTEGAYRLSALVGQNCELQLLLSFPGQLGPMYPLGPYPRIAEFRTMLFTLKAQRKEVNGIQFDASSWNGELFFGYVVTEGEAAGYWFRAHENGITLGFSNEGWTQVQELFRKTWANPELLRVWDQLSQEYGEL